MELMERAYTIEIGGRDVSGIVNDRLVSLTLSDNEGLESDTLSLTLDNRDFRIPIPNADEPLKLWLGYQGRLAFMGLFLVNDARLMGRPHLMTVECRAADMKESLKEPKTRSWNEKTLGAIAQQVAREHQLIPAISPRLSAITFPTVLQTDESDLNLLTRLVTPHDGMIKPSYGSLVVVERGNGLTASGQSMPTILIRESDLQPGYQIHPRARPRYQSVSCEWYDVTTGASGKAVATLKPGSAIVSKSNFQIREKVATAALANSRCEAKLKELARGTIEASFSTAIGDNRLLAGTKLKLGVGFHPEFIGLELSIKSAQHSVAGAYITSVTAERAN
jgi:phage protein D